MNEPHSLGGDRRLIDILVDHGCDAIPDEAIRELSSRRVDSVRPGFALETGLLLLGSRTRDGASSLLALLRMPIGERLFRAVWLGPFGRWFVRRAARGLTPAKIASTGNTGAAVVTPGRLSSSRASRISATESR